MSVADVATSPLAPARRPGSRMIGRPIVRIAVVLIALGWSLPTIGLLISSVRNPDLVRSTGWWTVFLHPFTSAQLTVSNYQQVLASDGLATAFLNSLIVTVPSTVLPVTIASFAAYAFAWMRFPGRRILFGLVVALMVMPIQMALIPLLRLYTHVDLGGTFLGTWLAHTGFALPLSTFLLYNYISQLPGEIFESALVDGASHFHVFVTLVVPLSLPALASFAIFQFLWVWNDLLVALVFLGTDSRVATLTATLNELVGTRGEAWYLLTAGAFVSMVVPVVVFLVLQRYFVRGLLSGSIKA